MEMTQFLGFIPSNEGSLGENTLENIYGAKRIDTTFGSLYQCGKGVMLTLMHMDPKIPKNFIPPTRATAE